MSLSPISTERERNQSPDGYEEKEGHPVPLPGVIDPWDPGSFGALWGRVPSVLVLCSESVPEVLCGAAVVPHPRSLSPPAAGKPGSWAGPSLSPPEQLLLYGC